MFEYYDEGDRKWKRMKDEILTDEPITISNWFARVGIKVRKN